MIKSGYIVIWQGNYSDIVTGISVWLTPSSRATA